MCPFKVLSSIFAQNLAERDTKQFWQLFSQFWPNMGLALFLDS